MCPEPPSTPTVSAHGSCGCPTASRPRTGSWRECTGSPGCWRASLTSCGRSAPPGPDRPSVRPRHRRTPPESVSGTSHLTSLFRDVPSCRESEFMTRHVVILAGGLSHERDVSLRSGSRLHEALRGTGMDVTLRDTDADLISWLADTKPDAAIITLHGSRGENGAIQGILEMSGVPYLGTPAINCRLAYEKNIAKNLVQRAGFPTPRWMSLSHSTFRDLGAQTLINLLISHLGLPLMVKPQHGGSALGATAVRAAGELPAALVNAFAYGDIAVVEQFVDGVELAVSVVEEGDGLIALPAVEISPDSGIFDYESRYTAGLTTYFTPARLDDELSLI